MWGAWLLVKTESFTLGLAGDLHPASGGAQSCSRAGGSRMEKVLNGVEWALQRECLC